MASESGIRFTFFVLTATSILNYNALMSVVNIIIDLLCLYYYYNFLISVLK